MSKYLKGNYQVQKEKAEPVERAEETVTQQFERRALERLGGSIAFVMKKNTFVWRGDRPDREHREDA